MIRIISAFLLGLICMPVFAHHPLGGMPMETFSHGLLSGFGHPVLGFDHLFFVVLVGIAALFSGRKLIMPMVYIVAMLSGCLLMFFGYDLPSKEFVIGLSLLILGCVVLSGRGLTIPLGLVIFSGFGLFHGSAFGDAIANEETMAGVSVLAGYLIGLGIIQIGIAWSAGWLWEKLWHGANPKNIQPRLAGALVAGMGLLITLEHIEGALLATFIG